MSATRKRHKPLPKRFSVAMSEAAYASLRALAGETCLGNNYVLTVLFENMDRVIDRKAFRKAVDDMLGESSADGVKRNALE